MLSIAHSATGAFLAAKLQNPLLYIPATLAAHYLEDHIAHWDVGTGLSNGTRKKIHAILLEFVDLALAGSLVFAMYHSATPTIQMHAAFGAFVGLVPDFMEAPKNFLHWNPWFLKPFNAFHYKVHHSTPNMFLGLLPQIAVIVGLWILR